MTTVYDSQSYKAVYYDRNHAGSAIEANPVGILLHHGGGTKSSDLHILTGKDPARKVGCHLYVTRAGDVYQLAPDTYAPWHAGAPDYASRRWWGMSGPQHGIVNGNRLIGIETEHRPGQDWPKEQKRALHELCEAKVKAWDFSLTRLGAHSWWAPSRKSDPADWPDPDLKAWFRTLYRSGGSMFEVIEPKGARIRQGPGVSFPIAETIPEGYQFWSDGQLVGEAVQGNSTWIHFAGPTRTIVNPLGFVWSGIVQEYAP